MPVVMLVCTFFFFFLILLAVYTLNLKCFIVTKLAGSNYYYFYSDQIIPCSLSFNNKQHILAETFQVWFLWCSRRTKRYELQNYLTCIFLLTWTKDLNKINLSSYNELLPSLDIWQLSSDFHIFEILQAI